ncbi:DUF998 domain-containing protein [uncultured Pseudonocardia sp.]|mgnify:FL=1|jgi:hypothetical protein|uniref:DUF998 domain-containing protein n=1 Tax=uncultured Pseudonocardia sp. TaxID=211455 RepID=UPI002628F06D|nr:DUF998 domain-containing protein [uncultured Pseudonocardia sp.]
MNEARSLVLSYLGLRRAVGYIGIGLPFVLLFGKLLVQGGPLPGSISAYYYSDMRNVLVGALFAVAIFLISYRYDRPDARAGVLAGVMAIGVALFPTSPADPTVQARVIGTVHLVCAAVFFLTLAYFSYFLFTRTDQVEPTPRKKQRNVVYRVCGILIVVCIVLAVLADNLLGKVLVDELHPVFWLESVAIVAFGVSWLIKGETILRDR